MAAAAELKPATLEAFERYVLKAEGKLQNRLQPETFLWATGDSSRLVAVRGGRVVAEPLAGKGDLPLPDGLVHDWIGSVFISGATLPQVLAAVQDYDNHKKYYRPEVLDSKLLFRDGNDFRIYLRLMKKKVITVVLNTEHDVRYYPLDSTRCYSRSKSAKIAELADPGTPREREKPAGAGHGFLWRLYSYWRFQEKDGGVYVECEAISLTRDVPGGLAWLIEPIIRGLPADSLVATLRSTREAVRARTGR